MQAHASPPAPSFEERLAAVTQVIQGEAKRFYRTLYRSHAYDDLRQICLQELSATMRCSAPDLSPSSFEAIFRTRARSRLIDKCREEKAAQRDRSKTVSLYNQRWGVDRRNGGYLDPGQLRPLPVVGQSHEAKAELQDEIRLAISKLGPTEQRLVSRLVGGEFFFPNTGRLQVSKLAASLGVPCHTAKVALRRIRETFRKTLTRNSVDGVGTSIVLAR